MHSAGRGAVWRTTTYDYDGNNRLWKITDPRGTTTTIGYDSRHRVASVTQPISTTPGDVATTTYSYGAPDSVCNSVSDAIGKTVLTDPRGKVTSYCWNDQMRVRKVRDADGNDRAREYTSHGAVQSFTELTGTAAASWNFNYAADGTDNLSGGEAPSGEQFSIGYCGASGEPACHTADHARYQPTSVTSPNGSKTHMSYNASGDTTRIGASTSGSADSVDLDYRSDGQLNWAEDGNDNRTNFSYDSDGNLIEIDPPGGAIGKTTFTVDSLSRTSSVRDGRHPAPGAKQIDDIDYDKLDRITRIEYGDGSWFAFDYDANGNMIERTDGSGATTANTTTYAYDLRNLRLSEDFPGTAFTAYSYDKAGNLATLTDPGGTVSYGYDDVNRVTTVTEPSSAVITLAYNDDDRHSTITFPGGIWRRTHTDKSGKTTSIAVRNSGGTLLRQLDYDYDDNAFCAGTTTAQRALVQKVTDEDENTTCYEYDLLDRLSYAETRNSANSLVESFDYDFDGASNRTKKVHQTSSATTTTSYAYNDANQLCWRAVGNHSNSCGSPPSGAIDYDYDTRATRPTKTAAARQPTTSATASPPSRAARSAT